MSLKLSLDGDATEALNRMIKSLKEEFPDTAISHSGLASWILKYFSEHGFEKSKAQVAKQFFNVKAYLRRKIKDLDSPEKVEEALTEVQNKLRLSKGKTERKVNGETGPTGA